MELLALGLLPPAPKQFILLTCILFPTLFSTIPRMDETLYDVHTYDLSCGTAFGMAF